MRSWKRVFASGLIVIGPILVTLYVVYRVYAIIAGSCQCSSSIANC